MHERRKLWENIIDYLPILAAIPMIAMTLLSIANVFILDYEPENEEILFYFGIILASIFLTFNFLNTLSGDKDSPIGLTIFIIFVDIFTLLSAAMFFICGLKILFSDELGFYINLLMALSILAAVILSFFKHNKACMILSKLFAILYITCIIFDSLFEDDVPSAFLRIPVGFFISWGAFFLLKGVFYHFLNVDDIKDDIKKVAHNTGVQSNANNKVNALNNPSTMDYMSMPTQSQQARPPMQGQTRPAKPTQSQPGQAAPRPTAQTHHIPVAPTHLYTEPKNTQPAPKPTTNSRLQRFIDKGNQ